MMQRSPCCCAFFTSCIRLSTLIPGGRLPLTTSRAGFDSQNLLFQRNSSSVSAAPGITKRYCSPLAATWTCRFCRVQSRVSTVSTGTCSSASRAARCSPVAPPTGKWRWLCRRERSRRGLIPPPPGSKIPARCSEVCLPGRSVGFAWRYPARGQRERVNFGHSFSS
ncbi:Uncharacterised protein [Klebsiella pneumoniae]|nr:Uncharacterised protein [Klebsiella pneumoniae]